MCFHGKPSVLALAMSSPCALSTAGETGEISDTVNGWCLGFSSGGILTGQQAWPASTGGYTAVFKLESLLRSCEEQSGVI